MSDKPDAILLSSNKSKFGVEIAHLYLDNTEAKYVLNKANVKHDFIVIDDYIKPLNELLKKKSIKVPKYNVTFPVDLLIVSASPLLGLDTIEWNKEKICIPDSNIRNIWLLVDNSKYTERWTDLVRIYND